MPSTVEQQEDIDRGYIGNMIHARALARRTAAQGRALSSTSQKKDEDDRGYMGNLLRERMKRQRSHAPITPVEDVLRMLDQFETPGEPGREFRPSKVKPGGKVLPPLEGPHLDPNRPRQKSFVENVIDLFTGKMLSENIAKIPHDAPERLAKSLLAAGAEQLGMYSRIKGDIAKGAATQIQSAVAVRPVQHRLHPYRTRRRRGTRHQRTVA